MVNFVLSYSHIHPSATCPEMPTRNCVSVSSAMAQAAASSTPSYPASRLAPRPDRYGLRVTDTRFVIGIEHVSETYSHVSASNDRGRLGDGRGRRCRTSGRGIRRMGRCAVGD